MYMCWTRTNNRIFWCIHNKTHGKKIPGQKTPRLKNNKAKLDIKHYSKIGQKTLLKKY